MPTSNKPMPSPSKIDDRATEHVWLTCRNHDGLAWLTKNIYPIGCRSVFFRGLADRTKGKEFSAARRDGTEHYYRHRQIVDDPDNRHGKLVDECDCPFSDLIVDERAFTDPERYGSEYDFELNRPAPSVSPTETDPTE